MRISFNSYNYISMGQRTTAQKRKEEKADKQIKYLLEPFSKNKAATIPPKTYMKGINPNSNEVFDTFTKMDDAVRRFDFTRTADSWDECLKQEIDEFNLARQEWEEDKTQQNFDHMEEEMGDIFFTAASIAKSSGIDAKEAFKSTNRKFYNRINIMERLCVSASAKYPYTLKDCNENQKRALWNTAKRKLYDAQSRQYQS